MPRLLVAAAFAVLTIIGAARADVVPDLYRGEAIVTGRDNLDERARGTRLALTQVLVKVSGDDRVGDHPWLPSILANAGTYVAGYAYEDRKKGIQISDEQGTRDRSYHLRVDFDPVGMHGILARLGLAPWHEDRPRLLVVLAVTDHVGPYVVGTESERGQGHRETLFLQAGRRGLPLVIPKMDSVETLALRHREVVETSGMALGALATSYGADAVLAGVMEITGDGYWYTRWTLMADGMPERWSVPNATFDRAIALGLGESARILAAAGTP